MTRTDEIFCAVAPANVIADVGCDHGLVSEKLLKANKAKQVIFTDVSAKCLKKAETLLADFVANGSAKPYCVDGLQGVTEPVEEVIIAGMGGEEIIKILSECLDRLPIKKLVLQPMKNCKEVRKFLIKRGFTIGLDYTFYYADKFYDLITAMKLPENVWDYYTEDEYEFGRQNLKIKEKDFVRKINSEINSVRTWLQAENLSEAAKNELQTKLVRLQSVLDG